MSDDKWVSIDGLLSSRPSIPFLGKNSVGPCGLFGFIPFFGQKSQMDWFPSEDIIILNKKEEEESFLFCGGAAAVWLCAES